MKTISIDTLPPAYRDLIHAGITARQKAYAPMSGFRCGAALTDENGKIYTGGNIETIDLTLTTHAEMSAVNSMIKTGSRRITALVCVVQADNGFAFPCGLCRQKIREFCADDTIPILCVSLNAAEQIAAIYQTTIGELYPYPFLPDTLTPHP